MANAQSPGREPRPKRSFLQTLFYWVWASGG